MKVDYDIDSTGKSTKTFPVCNTSGVLYIETEAPTQVRFYFAVNGKPETPYFQSLYVSGKLNENMINMPLRARMRIEADQVINSCVIDWNDVNH
jgi:hypothetical protein